MKGTGRDGSGEWFGGEIDAGGAVSVLGVSSTRRRQRNKTNLISILCTSNPNKNGFCNVTKISAGSFCTSVGRILAAEAPSFLGL